MVVCEPRVRISHNYFSYDLIRVRVRVRERGGNPLIPLADGSQPIGARCKCGKFVSHLFSLPSFVCHRSPRSSHTNKLRALPPVFAGVRARA